MKNLKKIFYSVSYMILVVMTFVYITLSHAIDTGGTYTRTVSVIDSAGFTGLPVIAIVLLIPSFIFGILALSINNRIIGFIRDLFGFFSGVFSIASVAVSFFYIGGAYYLPIILGVCSITLYVISAIALAKTFKESYKEEKEVEDKKMTDQIDQEI